MMPKRFLPPCLLLGLLLGLGGCPFESRVADGGTASETTNHVAGVLYENAGVPAARTQVLLVKSDFNPLTDTLAASLMDTTDVNGHYEIRNPDSGDYRIEAMGEAKGLYGLKASFHHAQGGQDVPGLNLQQPGYIRISLPESLWAAGGYLFIPGTTFRAYVGEHRKTLLGPLPAMKAPVLEYAPSALSARSAWTAVAKDIEILAGDTSEIIGAIALGDTSPHPVTVHSAGSVSLRFNTTPSGADIAEDISGFPLLVRLDSANFDFRTVRQGGAGIAFLKSDSTSLAYEIERWDSLAQKAEIWVRMDTIKGNSNAQTILMRLVSTGTGTGSGQAYKATAVFDSADGFVGVWHLGNGDAAAAGTGNRPDATGNGHWGVPVNFDGDEKSEGMVGPADRLDTLDDYLDLGVVNVKSAITVSAWVRADSGSNWTPIVQKPISTFPKDWVMSYGLWEDGAEDSLGFGVSNGSNAPYLDAMAPGNGWCLLHGTFDGRTLAVYRDGKPLRSETQSDSTGLEANIRPTLLGAYSDGLNGKFRGLVDEVRIECVARSQAWIKLSYENQKAGQTLIKVVR